MTSISRDTGWLVRKWIRLAFLLLPFSTVCHSQNTGQLYTFFKQSIGLNDSEIARIEQGKAVAKVLDSSTPSQVFVFGAVFINAQPSDYVRLSGDLDRLKRLPNYLALRRFFRAITVIACSGRRSSCMWIASSHRVTRLRAIPIGAQCLTALTQ